MITRYRNRAIKRLSLSLFFVLIVVSLIMLRTLGLPDAVAVMGGITFGTFAILFYVQGNIALAEAKGYDSSIVAVIILASFFCFFLGLFFIMPLILYFGLKDKHKATRHAMEPEPTMRNLRVHVRPLVLDDGINLRNALRCLATAKLP